MKQYSQFYNNLFHKLIHCEHIEALATWQSRLKQRGSIRNLVESGFSLQPGFASRSLQSHYRCHFSQSRSHSLKSGSHSLKSGSHSLLSGSPSC